MCLTLNPTTECVESTFHIEMAGLAILPTLVLPLGDIYMSFRQCL